MNLKALTDSFTKWLDSFVHYNWISTAIVVILMVIVTAVVAHLVTLALRRVLKSNKGSLPFASIFLNIGRVAVWVIGVCIILSSCFGVNVGAAVTALGVGGIAISLGLQETLSNLIGGLQIIMGGLVEPGEEIKVGGNEGVVCDVTWRHTTIRNKDDDLIVIPNSVINTEALIKISQCKDTKKVGTDGEVLPADKACLPAEKASAL